MPSRYASGAEKPQRAAAAEPATLSGYLERVTLQSDADTIAERVEQRTEREAPSPSLPQAETAERDVEAENPLTARRNARGPK